MAEDGQRAPLMARGPAHRKRYPIWVLSKRVDHFLRIVGAGRRRIRDLGAGIHSYLEGGIHSYRPGIQCAWPWVTPGGKGAAPSLYRRAGSRRVRSTSRDVPRAN